MNIKKILLFLFTFLIFSSVSFGALTDNNVAYWTLDNTLVDATGNGNTLTNDGATYTTSGKINGAYDFDGVNDRLYRNSLLGSSPTGFAVSIWAQFNTFEGALQPFIFGMQEQNIIRAHIFQDKTSSQIYFLLNTGGVDRMITYSDTGIDTNFHHYLMNWDGVRLVAYIDGVIVGNISASDTLSSIGSSANPILTIGSNQGVSTTYFDGIIDEPSIWTRALTTTEITELYNSGAGLQYPYSSPVACDTLEDRITNGCIDFTNEEFYAGGVTDTKTIELSNGKLAIAYIKSGTANYKICDLDGTNCGSEISHSSDIVDIDIFEDTINNKIVMILAKSTNGDLYTMNLDGTSLTYKLTFNSGGTNFVSAVQTSSTEFAIAYQDTADGSYGKLIICKLDGSSCGSEIIVYAHETTYRKILKPSNNKLELIQNSPWATSAHFWEISLDGNTITFKNSINGVISYIDMIEGSDNKLKITYMDGGNSNYGTFQSCDLDGTNCGGEIVFENDLSQYISQTQLNDKIFVSYNKGSEVITKNFDLLGGSISLSSTATTGSGIFISSLINSLNQLIISYDDNTLNKGMFAISEPLGSASLISIEQTFYQEQVGTVTLTGTNYVQILGGSFNISDTLAPMYGTTTLTLLSNESNDISCHMIIDGVNSNEQTRSNTAGKTGSMNILSDIYSIHAGTHDMSLQCKKVGSGQIQIDFAKGVGHVLSYNDNVINYQTMIGNEDIISGASYSDISSFVFETQNDTGFEKNIVIEWGGKVTNNNINAEELNIQISINDGSASYSCEEKLGNILSGNTVNIGGGGCAFNVINNTNYTVTLKGTGTNANYNISVYIKEFDLKVDNLNYINLIPVSYSGINQTIHSFTITNDEDNANLFLGLSSSVENSVGDSDTTTFFRVYDGSSFDETLSTIPYTINSDNTFLVRQDTLSLPKGTYTIDLISTCDSGTCTFGDAHIVSYMTKELDFTTQDFLITMFNDWDSTQILDYDVLTSDGVLYSTTNGNITINSDKSLLDLNFSSNGYIDNQKTNHNTTTDYNGTMWQSVFTITSKDLVKPFEILSFNVDTIKGVSSTTTGTLTLKPNLGVQNINFLSSYFNRSNINVTVNDTTGTFNVDPNRVELFFTRISDGESITEVSVTDSVLGSIGNSGNESSIMFFVEPGSHILTASKNSYIDSTETVVTNSSPVYSNFTFTLSPIITFLLYDEKTDEPFNVSGTDNMILRTICVDGSIIQSPITNNTLVTTITCEVEKLKFILEYPSDSYFRTIKIPNDIGNDTRIYLVDLLTTQAIKTTFSLFDLVNDYDDISLDIKKNINGVTRQITWDRVDATGKVIAYLIDNDQYILEVESGNQPVRSLGFYVAKETAGDVVLTLFDIAFSVKDTINYGNVYMSSYIDDNLSRLIGKYEDLTLSTSYVSFEVRKDGKFGQIVFTDMILAANSGEFTWNMDGHENETFYITMELTNKNGVVTHNNLINSNGKVGIGLVDFNLDMNWIITIFLGFLALTLTVATASTGALVLSVVAAMFVTFGWFGASWAVIATAIFISLLNVLREGEKK